MLTLLRVAPNGFLQSCCSCEHPIARSGACGKAEGTGASLPSSPLWGGQGVSVLLPFGGQRGCPPYSPQRGWAGWSPSPLPYWGPGNLHPLSSFGWLGGAHAPPLLGEGRRASAFVLNFGRRESVGGWDILRPPLFWGYWVFPHPQLAFAVARSHPPLGSGEGSEVSTLLSPMGDWGSSVRHSPVCWLGLSPPSAPTGRAGALRFLCMFITGDSLGEQISVKALDVL